MGELLALREGLLLTKNLGFVVNLVEVDTANVASGLTGDSFQWSDAGPIVIDIKGLFEDVGVVKCLSTPRNENVMAHTLAALAFSSMEYRVRLDSMPNCLELIIESPENLNIVVAIVFPGFGGFFGGGGGGDGAGWWEAKNSHHYHPYDQCSLPLQTLCQFRFHSLLSNSKHEVFESTSDHHHQQPLLLHFQCYQCVHPCTFAVSRVRGIEEGVDEATNRHWNADCCVKRLGN
ncbi:hypothetical protein QYF36_019887 [Acer negundo]|nr:hypothetical protein QYF36_019887 [Acer negundo]